MMLQFEYKDATPERKKQMITEIVSAYNMADKSQVVQCLAHAQAVLSCSQDEFSEVAKVSARTLREWKNREFPELYNQAYEKYTPEPELVDVDIVMDEDVLEQVFQNMMAKLSDKKTSAKDLSLLLSYFNISGAELRQFAKLRGSSLRSFIKDNETLLIKDEDTLSLVKSVLAESDYLYFGNEKTAGATESFLQMDMDNPLVRLEMQMAGMLMYSLWNGTIHPNFIEMAETLRILKMASCEGKDTKQAVREFDTMDNRPSKLKPLKITERECIDIWGAEEGKEVYKYLTSIKTTVDKKTAIKMPRYEDVKVDYENYRKLYTNEAKPLEVLLKEVDRHFGETSYEDDYKKYLNNQEDKDNE